MSIKLPPQYVNTPAFLIYSDISPSIIVTAIRIYGIAWNINRQHSSEDQMHAPVQFSAALDELTMVCRIEDRTLRGHLSVLSIQGVLRYAYSKRFNVYTFTLPPRSQWPQPVLSTLEDARGEKSAEICRHLSLSVVDDLPMFSFEDQQQSSPSCIEGGCGGEAEVGRNLPSSPGESVQGIDADEWERRLACMDLLGIRETPRSELSTLSHATSEYLMGWVTDKQRHPERGPGHYVLQIRACVPPPAGYEAWGTGRLPVARYEDMPEIDEDDEPILPAPDARQAAPRVDPSVTELWARVLGELALQMTQATYDTWLRGSEVVCAADCILTVAIKTSYAVDWLNTRLDSIIQRTMARLAGAETRVEFITQEEWRERADAHLVTVTR